MHKNILILSLAALLGCAHEEAQTLTTERDWEKGLDATHGPQIAPVGQPSWRSTSPIWLLTHCTCSGNSTLDIT